MGAARVPEKGFLQGYTPLTAVCIACNALGGLLVTMCIKYADAIVKDLALGLSICVSTTVSIYLFNFAPSTYFFAGVVITYAASLYAGNALTFGLFGPKTAKKE